MAVLVLLGMVLVFAVKLWVVEPLVVSATSMSPTLAEGDRIIVDKRAYLSAGPRVGDIVVFNDPEGGGRWLVKRVVATEGQTLDARDGMMTVDGSTTSIMVEVDLPGPKAPLTALPVTLGPDEVFVVGDNDRKSRDSRVFGPVAVSAVSGRVTAVYWPPQASRFVKGAPWTAGP